jgi:hypothetical protein
MIELIDDVLQNILNEDGVPNPLKTSAKSFDPPSTQFSPADQPTINLFLYDIRENLELRSNELLIARNDGLATLRWPPLRVACSYLITAWSKAQTEKGYIEEHKLLGQALKQLSRYPEIPYKFLPSDLRAAESVRYPTLTESEKISIPMTISHIDTLKTSGEFWTTMGRPLRPSISVTITISLTDVMKPVTTDLVTTIETGFEIKTGEEDEAGERETLILHIGGRVLNAQGKGIEAAQVDILDVGLRAYSDAEGYFKCGPIPPGEHTVRVVAVGYQPNTQTFQVPIRNVEDYNVRLVTLN